MLSLSKTYHLPWDLGGAELVVCLVQWQCSVLVHLHHSSRRGTSATTMDVYAAWLGGKPLLKRRGECPGWAVIWALGLGLVKYSPGLPVVSYKSAEAAAGRPSNELSNIVILLPSFTVHLHFQVFLSVSCSSFLLCSDLPSPEILYLACYLNRVGLLTIGTKAVDSRFLPWIPLL